MLSHLFLYFFKWCLARVAMRLQNDIFNLAATLTRDFRTHNGQSSWQLSHADILATFACTTDRHLGDFCTTDSHLGDFLRSYVKLKHGTQRFSLAGGAVGKFEPFCYRARHPRLSCGRQRLRSACSEKSNPQRRVFSFVDALLQSSVSPYLRRCLERWQS